MSVTSPSQEILTALPADPSIPVLVFPIDEAEPEPLLEALPVRRFSLLRFPWVVLRALGRGIEWVLGLGTLILALAFLAAVPLLSFLTLGYLLESGARIARNRVQRDAEVARRGRGRLSRFFLRIWLTLGEGVIGIPQAAQVGKYLLGVGLMLLPLQLVSSLYISAQIIEPGGVIARRWAIGLAVLTGVMGVHILLASLRGGKPLHFLWPIGNLIWFVRNLPWARFYTQPRDDLWNFVVTLRLPYYFWLGARGFFGALAWLVLPITLLALGRKVPPVGFVGAWYFGLLLLVLPIMQMQLAAENRFRAGFALRTAIRTFARAPWAWAFAQFVTLLLSLPLYVFKIEFLQKEVGGIPSLFFVLISLVFVVFIYPTRLATGWAYSRSQRRERHRHGFFVVTGLMWMVPTTAFYVLFVFLTQYVSWKGFASLYEQHPFLVPVPFSGW